MFESWAADRCKYILSDSLILLGIGILSYMLSLSIGLNEAIDSYKSIGLIIFIREEKPS